MARCAHCGGGGAKRRCPALEGRVCPRCCAQHQRREIQCPSDCRFLRQASGKDGYQTAVPKLLEFAMESEVRTRPAVARLCGVDKTLGEWEQPLVLAYLAYGYADANGDRSIDVFLRERGHELKAVEIEALEALQQTAWPSLFEVQDIEVDVGIRLTDLVTGDEIFVREKAATHQLKKFDLILGWLVRIGDHVELTGAGAGVPRSDRDIVLEAITKELRRLRKAHPGAAARSLLREAIVAGQMALRLAVENWRPPRIVTMDGEDVVLCESLFDVSDVAAVRAMLAAHPDMDEDGDEFTWVDREGREQLGDGPLILGTVRLEKGRLKLETKSRERIERGKELLSVLLAGIARHRVDAIKDLEVALEEHSREPERDRPEEVPEDVQAQIIGPYMQRHIESWIDEPLPALKGKTPRQAVKTRAGRAKVVSMLKDQENSMQRQPGCELVDFSVVYRELGLSR
jgi:hypothetical protein